MYIVFEGGEGCGKSTQVKLLAKNLKKLGYKVLITSEPGGTKAGKVIRELLLNKKGLKLFGLSEALLFYADRVQTKFEIILPALKSNYVVISDRSYFSTYAYQGFGRNLSMTILKTLTHIALSDLKPDLVLLLDIPVEVGIRRKKEQKEINRMDLESLEFHQRVRNGFLKLAKKNKKIWEVLDAQLSKKILERLILRHVVEKLS